ncbi:MAG: Holliday junction resolvase RuvX [Bacteroidaceae bacterium]|nr:Holliday junction resolvase RuvX [Bacteroidaceae bacterium]
MGRILSIDYGKRRTGLAVTDPSRIIANGLCTIETPQLTKFLADYFQRETVDMVIIGMPTQPNGAPSENAQRVLSFVRQFKNQFPQIPITEYDERFTSVLAHQTMLQSGISRMARRDKALVDEISATIILQSYMESRQYKQQIP